MDIQKRKLELIEAFLKIENEDVIARLEKILFLKKANTEKEHLKPMTVQELHERIDASMEDAKNDRVIDSSELKSRIEQWD